VSGHGVAVVGIDAATDPRRTGIAFATWTPHVTRVAAARPGESTEDLARHTAAWVADATRWLVAIDAPLGWPAPLGDRLPGHRAGVALGADPDALFRRHTDRAIQERVGKTPLEVGADRIARTAVAALELLAAIAGRVRAPLPLAWGPDYPGPGAAIEVYPAATLKAMGVRAAGYKRDAGRRAQLARTLGRHLTLPRGVSANEHVLDACLCVLAAGDFLAGRAPGPEDRVRAEREGWIWVREPRANGPDGPVARSERR
jgi:predicted RNase H-like nuclease